jgi:hypothetical protein
LRAPLASTLQERRARARCQGRGPPRGTPACTRASLFPPPLRDRSGVNAWHISKRRHLEDREVYQTGTMLVVPPPIASKYFFTILVGCLKGGGGGRFSLTHRGPPIPTPRCGSSLNNPHRGVVKHPVQYPEQLSVHCFPYAIDVTKQYG